MNADGIWVQEMQQSAAPECRNLRIRHRADTIFLLVMGGRVITMQTGFAMLESAFGRQMNSANIMMKNTMDLLTGAIVFFFLGYWIAYGASPHLDEEVDLDYAMWFCQFAYATTAATINSGALAGRVAFSSYLLLSVVLTGVIYPIIVRMTWGGGWLGEMGFVDFAGSAIVHLVGAVSAIVSASVCGPRIGRYENYTSGSRLWRLLMRQNKPDRLYQGPEDEVEKAVWLPIKTLNNPVQILFGVFILIIGFLAFNPASTFETVDDADLLAARATVVTLLFASGGGLACVAWSMIRTRSTVVTIPDFATAVLGAMVCSCAGCHVISPGISLLLGFFAALLALVSDVFLDRLMIDDPVSAVSVHGPPAILGVLAVPIFAKPHCQSDLKGLVYGGGAEAWDLLRIQFVGVLAIIALTGAMSYFTNIFIDILFGLRCGRAAELIGLDFVEHHYDDGSFSDNVHKQAILVHSPIREGLVQKVSSKLMHTPPKPYAGGTPTGSAYGSQQSLPISSTGSSPARPRGESGPDEVADLKGKLNRMLKQVDDLNAEVTSVKNHSRRRAHAVQQLLEAS
eukprot:CAMPEP_0178435874 /NCGR_PEP_ID=MMETSP0689_2-20121128/34152_1 /TAXON_ID=160604 /ORGANISM="Amphidinium massartii, Strain CS-259" /LENGTH=567 /DNA_ID=CAMNT_0020057959 /DNA_START=249 /DNA_END=1949 /DNA_ORIENTATION=-